MQCSSEYTWITSCSDEGCSKPRVEDCYLSVDPKSTGDLSKVHPAFIRELVSTHNLNLTTTTVAT